MILELMNTRFQKKFLLLEYLYHNQSNPIEINELVKIMHLSYPTIKKLIVEVKQDIHKMGFANHAKITDQAEQNRLSINITEEFSINLVQLYYLENSVRFKLFSLFLSPRKWTVLEIMKKLDITYSPAKKEIARIKKYINSYAQNISLVIKREIYLEGDERTIRMLYTGIFQHVYGGYKWPFSFINLSEVSDILEILSPKLYKKYVTRYTTIHYGVAISLYRSQKINVSDNPYFWKPTTADEKKVFNKFVNQLRQKVPTVAGDLIHIEARFLVSCLLANSLGYENEEFTPFFYNSKVLSEMGFLKIVEKKVETIESYALIPFSSEQRKRLYLRLLAIFYQILIYEDVLKQKVLDFYVYYPFEFPGNHERERSFYKIIMEMYSKKKDSFELSYIEYICAAYYKILFFEINKELFHPKIKVLVFSNKTPERLISGRLNTILSFFSIEIVNNLDNEVDIIISDMAISKQNLIFLPKRVPIILIREEETISDSNKLLRTLTKIADNKYKTIKEMD
ncbi:helix-turn-helix domain-containing protein [Enterococcus hulanensis]|uniref:helix-turn-helix domain-containing protein n=1 Tax=Enterococcus hulanensis TaxID=2559929 RepID=UPI00288E75C0|nr:helix-turn-helix domain-containing protein [Enterococcus hulanensis]MDT2660360.1 helix-turn-helix domain-containing protein [Enterococcus hulanensis]